MQDDSSELRYLKLRDVFPAQHAVGRILFRLAVLREDLRLEAYGMTQSYFAEIAGGDVWYPRVYFMRRNAQTLAELCRILFVVENGREVVLEELRAYLSRLPGEVRGAWLTEFEERIVPLRALQSEIKTIRDEASAHLNRERCAQVLDGLAELLGPIRLGNSPLSTYVGIACHAIGLGCVDDPRRIATEKAQCFDPLMKRMKAMFDTAIVLLDLVLRVRLETEGIFKKGLAASHPEVLEMYKRARDLAGSQ